MEPEVCDTITGGIQGSQGYYTVPVINQPFFPFKKTHKNHSPSMIRADKHVWHPWGLAATVCGIIRSATFRVLYGAIYSTATMPDQMTLSAAIKGRTGWLVKEPGRDICASKVMVE